MVVVKQADHRSLGWIGGGGCGAKLDSDYVFLAGPTGLAEIPQDLDMRYER